MSALLLTLLAYGCTAGWPPAWPQRWLYVLQGKSVAAGASTHCLMKGF